MRLNRMRFNFSKLNQPIKIYEVKSQNIDGMSKKVKEEFLKCFAHVETVSLKDYQTSIQTGTQNNIKVFIRNYPGITNKMILEHEGQEYNIKQIIKNYRQSGFSILVAEEVSR